MVETDDCFGTCGGGGKWGNSGNIASTCMYIQYRASVSTGRQYIGGLGWRDYVEVLSLYYLCGPTYCLPDQIKERARGPLTETRLRVHRSILAQSGLVSEARLGALLRNTRLTLPNKRAHLKQFSIFFNIKHNEGCGMERFDKTDHRPQTPLLSPSR